VKRNGDAALSRLWVLLALIAYVLDHTTLAFLVAFLALSAAVLALRPRPDTPEVLISYPEPEEADETS
jgi:uncharacterized membrane protein YhaH (DUF805 family)